MRLWRETEFVEDGFVGTGEFERGPLTRPLEGEGLLEAGVVELVEALV